MKTNCNSSSISILDLIGDDWIQFFLPSYHDKSKWFSYLWTMNMNKKFQVWSLEDIGMVEEMNYETNVRQLVVLHSRCIFFSCICNWLRGSSIPPPKPYYQTHIYILVSTGPDFNNNPRKIYLFIYLFSSLSVLN